MDKGHIFIDDVITPDTLAYVKAKLQEYQAVPEIDLHIQSAGGSVYDGYKIYHELKKSGKKITSIVEGEAQSMATFIALAGDVVKICNPSVFMIHNPRFMGLSKDQVTAEDLEQGASELRNIEYDMAHAYSAKTGMPVEQIQEMMRKETKMNARQAVTMKFADVLLGSYLQAVALGQTTKNPMKKEETNFLKETFKSISKVFASAAEAGAMPTAVSLETDKGMLMVDSEDGEFEGKMATIDGQPANGTYALKDGRSITCENGIVKSVQQAAAAAPTPAPIAPLPAPAPPPMQTADQKLAEAQAKIELLEQAKAAAEAGRVAAEQKVAAGAVALGEVKKEIEKIKTTTIGDDAPPAVMIPAGPQAAGKAAQRERTLNFLAEHMPWVFQYYKDDEIKKYASGPNMVSILETNFNYTYPGILTTDIFYKPSLGGPALTELFTIDQGIKSHKQYNLVNPISKILKPYTGCDRVFNSNRAFITNTTVRTKEFQVNESWCKDDFTGYLTGAYNFLAQEWLKTGIDSFDPSGTPIDRVIDNVLSNALRIDVFRRASFAAGNSSDDDYNQFDGLWDRLIDSSGASNYCVVRAGSALGTGTLAAGAALTALEAVYAGSNILLKDWENIYGQFSGAIAKPTFWVTRSVWDNYYNSLIGTGAVTEQAFENLQKGLTTLTYKGFPVRPIGLWDQFLAESDNPLFATTRHLILFTTKDNHILGVEQGSDLNKIEGWYERKDRKFYYEADLKMGYNYLHCDLQTIAY